MQSMHALLESNETVLARSPGESSTLGKWLWALPMAVLLVVAHVAISITTMGAVATSELCAIPHFNAPLTSAQRATITASVFHCSEAVDLVGILAGILVAILFFWPIARIYGRHALPASVLLGAAPVAYWLFSSEGAISTFTWPEQAGSALMLLALATGSTLTWTFRRLAAEARS